MEIEVASEKALQILGERLGALFVGGEGIELVGDVGAGKTTLVKAVARGMGIDDALSSPSYTLSQVYEGAGGLRLAHYDFYRLNDPGILANELQEMLADNQTVVAVEWADIVQSVLPTDHVQIQIVPLSDTARRLVFTAGGEKSRQLLEQLV